MIVGIEGNLGNGKSATMARMAFHYSALCTECNGIIDHNNIIPVLFDDFDVKDCSCEKPHPYKIHANFWLNGIPDVHYVTCIDDISKIYNGVFFADEFWHWIDSRGSGFNEINKIVSDIMLTSRKRGFSIVYESKLIHMTDRRIRELTDYVLRPNKYIDINGELTKIEQHMLFPINMTPYKDNTYIVVDELSGVSLDVVEESLFQFKLSDVADKYDTREEIATLSKGEKSPGIEKGIKMEKAFIYNLENQCGREGEIVHSPQSRGIDVKYDGVEEHAAYDVVTPIKLSRGRKTPQLNIREKNIEAFLNTAKKNGLTPYFSYVDESDGEWRKLPMLKRHIGMTKITTTGSTKLIKRPKNETTK